MKGHTRKHREAGGVNEAAEDLKSKPEEYNHGRPEKEAEERKHGGRTKRKLGGHVHHEHGKHLAHAKHVGHVHGEHHMAHAGRKPRKSGGRAGSEANPFTSALHGTPPKGHKVEKESMGMDK